MSTHTALRVRRSLGDLQADYERGDKKPLEDLMRAWKAIKELEPTDPRSFFVLGGYHGEPFRGAGWSNSQFWGGYCNHGNVLFPVWHRIYVNELESALRSIPGCADVALAFWDECSADSLTKGIPWALTVETFELDGQTIPNPLRSYKLPVGIVDHLTTDDPDTGTNASYSKPKDYDTVRYPYSGLAGTQAIREQSAKHNEQWPYPKAVELLDANIVAWLTSEIVVNGKAIPTGVAKAFATCLDAPDYTRFSNTTSAQEWNSGATTKVVPLESPHNDIHLAVGGFDVPGPQGGDFSPIPGANGDMGENDTAALDPIFFFHHCFIDRVFWLWQKRHGATQELEIEDHYPGTNSVDGQGATPGVAPNSWLTLDTPLHPFTLEDDGTRRPYSGRDACDIEGQLGYTYGPGSLDELADAPSARSAQAPADEKQVHVSGVDRGKIHGSFVIAAYAAVDGERKLIGREAVLSRWHVGGCANCQTHLRAGATFSLHGLDPDELGEDAIQVELVTRDPPHGGPHGLRASPSPDSPPRYSVEVR